MSPAQTNKRSTTRFRIKLLGGMMLVVSGLTVLGLYLAQRKVAANAERDLQQNFQAELSSLHKLQDLRHAALAERCRALAAKPRIHAALEDNALDLLYPSAKDDLRDLMEGAEPSPGGSSALVSRKVLPFSRWSGCCSPASESAGRRDPKCGVRGATGVEKIT